MVFGMSLETFTLLHAVISLVGIVTGLVVLLGLLAPNRLDGWTAVFLTTTALPASPVSDFLSTGCCHPTLSGLLRWRFSGANSVKAQATPATAGTITSKFATVDGGVKLHYLAAGSGPTLILLHGYTQTSRMWRPIMPLLAQKFSVIAPDLPGIRP